MQSTFNNVPSTGKYVVFIANYDGADVHWFKGCKSLQEARSLAKKKISENEKISNRILIIKGEIIQIGG